MSRKTAVATPENPRNIRERIIEMIEEFGNAPDDFDPGKIADEAIRLLAEDRHVLAQQFVGSGNPEDGSGSRQLAGKTALLRRVRSAPAGGCQGHSLDDPQGGDAEMTRAEAGRKGGTTTAKRYGRQYMAEIGRKGGLYREPTLSELRQLAELKKKKERGKTEQQNTPFR